MTWKPITEAPLRRRLLIAYQSESSGFLCGNNGVKNNWTSRWVDIGTQMATQPGVFRVKTADGLKEVKPFAWDWIPEYPEDMEPQP